MSTRALAVLRSRCRPQPRRPLQRRAHRPNPTRRPAAIVPVGRGRGRWPLPHLPPEQQLALPLPAPARLAAPHRVWGRPLLLRHRSSEFVPGRPVPARVPLVVHPVNGGPHRRSPEQRRIPPHVPQRPPRPVRCLCGGPRSRPASFGAEPQRRRHQQRPARLRSPKPQAHRIPSRGREAREKRFREGSLPRPRGEQPRARRGGTQARAIERQQILAVVLPRWRAGRAGLRQQRQLLRTLPQPHRRSPPERRSIAADPASDARARRGTRGRSRTARPSACRPTPGRARGRRRPRRGRGRALTAALRKRAGRQHARPALSSRPQGVWCLLCLRHLLG